MNSLRHISRTSSSTPSLARATTGSATHRPPAYRRISSFSLAENNLRPASPAASPAASSFSTAPKHPSTRPTLLRSPLLPQYIALESFSSRISSSSLPPSSRSFHTSSWPLQQQQEQQQTKKAEAESEDKTKATSDPTSKEGEKSTQEANKDEEKTKEGEEHRHDQKSEGEERKEGDKEGKEGKEGKEKKEEPPPPPPPHGDKSPLQVFMDTMQTEFKASKEWNEGTKAIADSAHQFKESEQVRKAREAYEKTSGVVTDTASTVIKSTATAVGKGAQWTWETPVMKGVRKGANVTGDALDKATKPIRETEAFKSVKETIDDGSSSRYGGWVEKDERRRRRERRDKKLGLTTDGGVLQEDPNAGTNVTLHKDAAWKEAWRDFRDQNKVMQRVFGLKAVYQESENPLISTARGITDSIAGFFSENETAEVIKQFRAMDPNFTLEPFLEELREYILPEVLDAYVKGDTGTLKQWLSAAQYSVYEALTKQYLAAGLRSDGRILDIRGVDILRARMLEPGDIPVFIITCRTQEVHVYRKAKTGDLAAGMEDKVQQVTYAIGITRTPEDVNNPETRGWRLIEMQKSGRNYY